MTRTEFDQQIRLMREKKRAALQPIIEMRSEVNEELADLGRRIARLTEELQKAKMRRSLLIDKYNAVEKEWIDAINTFITKFGPTTTSNLADATLENILYELKRRKYVAVVSRMDEETGDIYHYTTDKCDWKTEADEL